MNWLRTELVRAAIPICAAVIATSAAAGLFYFVATFLGLAIFAGVTAFLFAIPFTLAYALILGLPAYLVVRLALGDACWWNAIPIGFAIGVLSHALNWAWGMGPRLGLAYGWLNMLLFGLFGAVGGAAFWRTLVQREHNAG